MCWCACVGCSRAPSSSYAPSCSYSRRRRAHTRSYARPTEREGAAGVRRRELAALVSCANVGPAGRAALNQLIGTNSRPPQTGWPAGWLPKYSHAQSSTTTFDKSSGAASRPSGVRICSAWLRSQLSAARPASQSGGRRSAVASRPLGRLFARPPVYLPECGQLAAGLFGARCSTLVGRSSDSRAGVVPAGQPVSQPASQRDCLGQRAKYGPADVWLALRASASALVRARTANEAAQPASR